MFTHLDIANFKAWKRSGAIRLAPLTVIFGANSAGKSSLGQLLLALKQTAMSAERRRPLQLGGDNSLVDLGAFADVLHNHDLGQPLQFELGWRLPEGLVVRDSASSREYRGDELRLRVDIRADAQQQPRVQVLRYELRDRDAVTLGVEYRRRVDGAMDLASTQYRFEANGTADFVLDEPDKFYRVPDRSRAHYRNAEFLSDLALQTEAALARLVHLGPLRDYPKRLYAWSGETPEDVGPKGERAIPALLAATAAGRKLARGAGEPDYLFDQFIAQWLKELGIIDDFVVRPLAQGRTEHEVLLKPLGGAIEVRLTDVGFGVSQILPALVQPFYCAPHTTVWMEQPEIHLHPQVQAELADVFIAATQAHENGLPRHVQLVVESHSEHFLNRVQRRVAEGRLAPGDVAIYFCRRAATSAELEPLRLNEFGEIENWPENFFGDEMADISGRALAALQRSDSRTKGKGGE
ncbi:MAG: DUF3696 domain-containing protein [Gammaproteobacteria bacterium]